jgi:dCTP deaminase
MILTDKEIADALDKGFLVIKPRPTQEAFSSTTVDLTLAGAFAEWPAAKGLIIRPGEGGYSYNEVKKLQTEVRADSFTLKPHSLVLAWTAERLSIPAASQLAARVEGKSSLARLGLCVHMTAPTVHSGFGSVRPLPIQLEMVNFGPNTLILDAGMPICQLIFERTGAPPDKPYAGKFQQQGPSAGKAKKKVGKK